MGTGNKPVVRRIPWFAHEGKIAVSGSNPRHPVIIIDDAQRGETDSLCDMCSLLFQSTRQTVAASLILVGDENLAKCLDLYAMTPICTRMTGIIKLPPLNEQETREFIRSRLYNAEAPEDLFDKGALDLIAAHTRGNRRDIMNTATMALEEAYYRQEKTITAETLYDSGFQRIRVKRRRLRGDSGAKG